MVNGFSQENALEETIKKQIGYNEDDFFSFDVKELPGNANLAVAVAIRFTDKLLSRDDFEADLELILFDIKKEKILNKLEDTRKFTSDAVELQPVVIDTINYKINSNGTAFGINVSYVGGSRVYNYSTEDLFLYNIDNGKIKSISEAIQTYKLNGEWDMKCTYDGEKTKSILIMDKKMTNGFYDIKIKSTKTIMKSVAPENENDDCIETNTTLKPEISKLVFRNGKYSLE